MLVLSRREGERITIGGGITITVVRIDSHAVRIGIEAPPDVHILRDELLPTAVTAAAHSRPIAANRVAAANVTS